MYVCFYRAVFNTSTQTSSPTERAVESIRMQATSCSMRPGGYRSFTFRLPAHLPTAHIAVAVSRGCVSLFASNCSRTPRELKLEPAATQHRAPAWWPSKVLMPPLAAWSVTPWAALAHCHSTLFLHPAGKPQPHACQWQRSSVRAFAHVSVAALTLTLTLP